MKRETKMKSKQNVTPIKPRADKAPIIKLEMLGPPINGMVLVDGLLPYPLALALGAYFYGEKEGSR
jgi:hypothetical protein